MPMEISGTTEQTKIKLERRNVKGFYRVPHFLKIMFYKKKKKKKVKFRSKSFAVLTDLVKFRHFDNF